MSVISEGVKRSLFCEIPLPCDLRMLTNVETNDLREGIGECHKLEFSYYGFTQTSKGNFSKAMDLMVADLNNHVYQDVRKALYSLQRRMYLYSDIKLQEALDEAFKATEV